MLPHFVFASQSPGRDGGPGASGVRCRLDCAEDHRPLRSVGTEGCNRTLATWHVLSKEAVRFKPVEASQGSRPASRDSLKGFESLDCPEVD
jgi:hypothetical protein